MARLEVRTIGDPVLEQVATEVEQVDDALRQLLDDMLETMRDERGIGLAAPQVGISHRIVVIELDGRTLKLVNPRIVERRGRSKGMEACLSVPELDGEVERADWIRLEYLDETGAAQVLEAGGLLARCVQHELDHLDGVLLLDLIDEDQRREAKRTIREMQMGLARPEVEPARRSFFRFR